MKRNNRYECLSNDSVEVQNGIGKNRIPPPEKEPLWMQYLEKFKDPIIIVLLVVFGFSLIVSGYEFIWMDKGWSLFLEPLGVLLALLLATGVAFIFEVKANKEFEILNKVKDARPVKVYRMLKGKRHSQMLLIKKHDVVVGDVVKLESGDEIPADGELIESNSLRVDESNFTGEPYATKTTVEENFVEVFRKKPSKVSPEKKGIAYHRNPAWVSSLPACPADFGCANIYKCTSQFLKIIYFPSLLFILV